MSYDKSETDYCLIATGWVLANAVPPNETVIERWTEKTYQGSGYGKESKHPEMTWSNPDFTQEQRGVLHVKFPPPWSEEAMFRQNQEFSRTLQRLGAGKKNSI
jgi:hypothetical protein